MRARCFWICAIALGELAAPAVLHAQPPVGTSFSYQGQLKEAGAPCEGTYDFLFQLWDGAEGGAMVSGDLYVDDWPVGAGLFTVQLDFGDGMFSGDERWLQVHVRPGDSSGSYTELSPRQPLTAAPYALYALSGPGSGGFWAANADDIYNTNSGNVGIGMASPGYPLHVESDGGPVAYVRNNGASGRALYARSNGTAVYAEGGGCGLDAYAASPTGNAISAFNEAESGNAYAVYGESISPDGIAIYGHTSNGGDYAGGIGVYGFADNDGYYSTGIGVYGRSESDHGGAGVYGEGTATGGESAYGVHGVSTSSAGVRGENSGSGNYGILGADQYGVYGRGNSAGGHFEDADGTSSVDVAWGYFGISAEGSLGGGVFADSDGSANADIAHGDRGLRAGGTEYGGLFHDTDSSGQAYVGCGDRGIEAEGSEAGGYFEDTDGSGEAYVGSGDEGIRAYGTLSGGYFADSDGSGYARVGHADDGIRAYGANAGGLFGDYDDSGYAYVGSGDEGIRAYGTVSGGYFADSDDFSYARVAYGDLGIEAYGNTAGARFEDADDVSIAYVADGTYGISAYGQGAGGYFEDQDGSGYAYVGRANDGIQAWGNLSGGYFVDLDSGTWSEVAAGTDKINSNGSCDFVQNHPEDPEAVVVYACPEGDEVATYTRGTARLQKGVARVPLGETFKWVTNPDIGLTAHLTPRGTAVSLAVVSLTTEELIVRGPPDGPDDVAFDYLVFGLRIGFEEVSVVQEKMQEAYIPSMADHRALYERRPELRGYNALERFKRMRAAVGQTEPLDLSASQTLRDAIVEFDPAVHSLDDRRELEAPESIGLGEDAPREQRPRRLELVDPKDAELAGLRARVGALEALVARSVALQNGDEQ